MIVLDTHTTIWWTQAPEYLGAEAAKAIDSAEILLVPTIVFWEIALLVRKKRLAIKQDMLVEDWAADVLSIPRVREVPITHEIAIQADALDMHPDPADRFIVSSALYLSAPLATKDSLLAALPWLTTIW